MIQIPEGFKVAEATVEECYKILSEPQLINQISIEDISGLYDYIERHKHTFHRVSFKSYSMLFFHFEVDATRNIHEVHIVCPKNSIIASRALAIVISVYLAGQGAEVLITACSKGKIANMARKIGWTQVKQTKDRVYFMLSLLQIESN